MSKKTLFLCVCFGFGIILHAQNDFAQQINQDEKKYLQLYFDAEKYKVLEEYDQALILYEQCIALSPEESSAYNEIAKLYFYFQEWDNAEYYIKEAIRVDPSNRWYYYLLIDIYVVQNKLAEQLDAYSNLIDIDPENHLYYFQKIHVLKDLKLYKKAIKFIKKTESKIGPSNDLLIELKSIYLAQNDFIKSEKTALELIKKSPNNTNSYNELASVYLHFSKYDKAITIYKELLTLEPNNPIAIIALYQIYANKKDTLNQEKYLSEIINNNMISLETKKDIFYELLIANNISEHESLQLIVEKAIELYPAEPIFNLILAEIYAKNGKYDKAIPSYKNSLNSGLIKDEYIYTKLVEIYFTQENFSSVLNILKQAIDRYPYNPRLYYYQGLAFFNKKEYNKTIDALLLGKDYIVDDPLFKSEFFSLIGDSYHKISNNPESDQAYNTALKYNENNVFVLNNYSYYLSLREEKLDLAREMIIKCNELTLDSPNASFIDTYAWVLYKLEEYDLAKKEILKAVKLEKNSVTIFDHYGDILYELGFLNDAIIQWKKALSLSPDDLLLKNKIQTHE